MQANPPTIYKTTHACMYMNRTHQYRQGAREYMYLCVHTNHSGLVNSRASIIGHIALSDDGCSHRLTNRLKPGTHFVLWTILSYIYGKKKGTIFL